MAGVDEMVTSWDEVCGASPIEVRHDPVSGQQTSYEFEFCARVNHGNCPLFEEIPAPLPREPFTHWPSIIMALVVILDTISTLWLSHTFGKGMELNLLLSHLLDYHPAWFVAVKIIPMAVLIGLCIKAKREHWLWAAILAYVSVYLFCMMRMLCQPITIKF